MSLAASSCSREGPSKFRFPQPCEEFRSLEAEAWATNDPLKTTIIIGFLSSQIHRSLFSPKSNYRTYIQNKPNHTRWFHTVWEKSMKLKTKPGQMVHQHEYWRSRSPATSEASCPCQRPSYQQLPLSSRLLSNRLGQGSPNLPTTGLVNSKIPHSAWRVGSWSP